MNDWANQFVEQAKESLDTMISETLHIDKDEKITKKESDILHSPFRLPISYIDERELHELSPIVSEDLELVETKGDTSLYEKLFQPSHILGANMIEEWKNHFTSNEQYLLDTQKVILKTDTLPDYSYDVDKLMSVYKELKVNESYFLEKYGYIEWDFLKLLNKSSSFLQILSVIDMTSPVLSLILPIFFFNFSIHYIKIA